jgi:hypothetical protein
MTSKTSLSLESLDRREVPASIASPPVGMELQEVFVRPEPGCWPGPPPAIYDDSIIEIGSRPDVQGPDPTPWAGQIKVVTPGLGADEFVQKVELTPGM